MEKSCHNCRFFEWIEPGNVKIGTYEPDGRYQYVEALQKAFGECKEHPPVAQPRDENGHRQQAEWPIVHMAEWCGKWADVRSLP